MRAESPSQTAFATAWLRALHLAVDEPPYVFEDNEAARLLPAFMRRYLRRLERLPLRWLQGYRSRWSILTSMRGHVVVRARYAEDALAAARQKSCVRHLILAAGLDTFAIRQAESDAPIQTVEIDHPATQRWKRKWMNDNGHAQLPNLELLPVDFERASLADVVHHWKQEAQFISWLGTTYYLSQDAVVTTLKTLAGCSGPGSELVLDYWQQSLVPDANTMLLAGTRIATALQREPMKTFFDPDRMRNLAESAGWHVRENCTPEMQFERFLSSRSDGLSVPSFAHLLHLER